MASQKIRICKYRIFSFNQVSSGGKSYFVVLAVVILFADKPRGCFLGILLPSFDNAISLDVLRDCIFYRERGSVLVPSYELCVKAN
jgi:hypothetical protein